jgi:hypothetical protein
MDAVFLIQATEFYWVGYRRPEDPEVLEVFGSESRAIVERFARESRVKGYTVGTVNVRYERKSA